MRTSDLIINNTSLSCQDLCYIIDKIKQENYSTSYYKPNTFIVEFLKKKYKIQLTYLKRYTKIEINYDKE